MALKWTLVSGILPPGTRLNPNGTFEPAERKTVFDYSNYGDSDWRTTIYIHHFELKNVDGHDILAEAIEWCGERFGVGADVSNDVFPPTKREASWVYDLIDMSISISDYNHAFEFRIRWC